MTWKPHVTVAAIAERGGRFLMVEEVARGRTVYNQPAGHLDEGESLVDAVIRETLEETAHRFRPTAITGVYRWRNPENRKTFLRVAFCGDCDGHDPDRPLDRGIRRAVWLTREELALGTRPLRSPLVLRCLDDYLAGLRFPLALLHDLGDAR